MNKVPLGKTANKLCFKKNKGVNNQIYWTFSYKYVTSSKEESSGQISFRKGESRQAGGSK